MRRIFGIVVLATLLAAFASPVSAKEPDPADGIFHPTRDPYGVAPETWLQRYMQWIFGGTVSTNPVLNPGCSNLVGGVWYMPHTFFDNQVKLHCTVNSATPILITPGGFLCDTSEGVSPGTLRSCAEVGYGELTNVRLWIDGVRIWDLDQWVVSTPVFRIRYPEDNIWDVRPGAYPAAAKAGILMLRPLSVGRHTIIVNDQLDQDVARVTAFLKVVRAP
jgi:hypothetical protein